jgi:cyanophycinase
MSTVSKSIYTILLLILSIILSPFAEAQSAKNTDSSQGKLFIIGGGKRGADLMKDLIHTAELDRDDYVVILPMSSQLPDSAVIWAQEDFAAIGVHNVKGMNFKLNESIQPAQLDSLENAKLIYISGGDQNRFMEIVGKGKIYNAIHKAYAKGATIAGTSAGAAVMSKKMITGNSIRYPEYTGLFPTIEADNIEIGEGLGLMKNAIIDQHFVERQRMNRLIAAALENPDEICIGIAESTAIVVTGNSFRVTGESQVIVLRNPRKSKRIVSGLLGGSRLILDILLPGDRYDMRKHWVEK